MTNPLTLSLPDNWTEHDTPIQFSAADTEPQMLARLEHDTGEHHITISKAPTPTSNAEYEIAWLTEAQSMTREPSNPMQENQNWTANTAAEATMAVTVLMNAINTMEDRADHKVAYAIDGPYDY